MFTNTIVLSGLAALANAHIIITNPVPYGRSSLTNGPLDASGSDFPCKQRNGVYEAEGASNVFAQGSTQQLAFQGTAVHGGGSCQVSVTTDLKPTKDSVWKVIKSIEGGCPAKGQTGNLGSNAAMAVPYEYDYEIPEELAAGNYTLAWTWFNKVGNREMYMNCAPLTVTGSGGSDSFIDTLPNMFVANVGNGCGTKSGTDVLFPNPGEAVAKFNEGTTAFDMPTAAACQQPTGGGGNGPTPTDSGDSKPTSTSSESKPTSTSTESKPTSSSVESKPTSTPSKSLPGGVFVTKPTDDPEPSSNNGGGAGPSGGHASGSACSDNGAWNCVDGKSFQRCASGMWTAVQPMAQGVGCEAGVSADMKMIAHAGKRAMRRAVRMPA